MTMPKYTPGPWLKLNGTNAIISSSKRTIGWVMGAGEELNKNESNANIALIAAAPQMRAALEVCFDYLTNREAPLPEREDLVRLHAEAMGKALAAMNLADGEENE